MKIWDLGLGRTKLKGTTAKSYSECIYYKYVSVMCWFNHYHKHGHKCHQMIIHYLKYIVARLN